MSRVLVIGMNPSNKPALKGKVAKNSTFDKLHKWMDELGVHYFSFCNTFDYAKDKPTQKDVDFKRLCTLTKDYDKIICLGGFVSNSLNRIDVSHFKMPHPSPRNRLLNDKGYERRLIDRCKEYLK